jgi:hypothetical protein
MTSIYEGLICDLKIKLIKLKKKNIKFNEIFSLINNEKFVELNTIIDDEPIQRLIKNIVAERETIGNNIEIKLNNLLWLNDRLIQFGEEPQTSKTKALNLLKTKVFINIYDLAAEKYEKRTTQQLLRKELRNKCGRRFPLHSARENISLKCFLIKL